jgi:hypothetical protein
VRLKVTLELFDCCPIPSTVTHHASGVGSPWDAKVTGYVVVATNVAFSLTGPLTTRVAGSEGPLTDPGPDPTHAENAYPAEATAARVTGVLAFTQLEAGSTNPAEDGATDVDSRNCSVKPTVSPTPAVVTANDPVVVRAVYRAPAPPAIGESTEYV